jgi:hypothetical protein
VQEGIASKLERVRRSRPIVPRRLTLVGLSLVGAIMQLGQRNELDGALDELSIDLG